MKRPALFSVLASALLLFAGCGNDPEPKPTPPPSPGGQETTDLTPEKITVDPNALTMTVGDTQQLKVTCEPQNDKYVVLYESNNTAIATISEQGLIKAIGVGECKITVKVGKKSATVAVTVQDQGGAQPKVQMPLLKFPVQREAQGRVTDPEVLKYEAALGRTPTDYKYSEKLTFTAYVNTKLESITAAIYAIEQDEYYGVFAFAAESFNDCPKLMAELQNAGFTKFQDITVKLGDDQEAPGFRAINDKDRSLQVMGYQEDNEQFASHITIEIASYKDSEDATHEFVPGVKDFPSIEMLKTLKKEKITEFEDGIGFRSFDASNSTEKSWQFTTKEDQINKSNIEYAYYVTKAQVGSYPFIASPFNSIKNLAMLESQEVKDWLATNGYDKNYTVLYDAIQAQNANGDEVYLTFMRFLLNGCVMYFSTAEEVNATRNKTLILQRKMAFMDPQYPTDGSVPRLIKL